MTPQFPNQMTPPSLCFSWITIAQMQTSIGFNVRNKLSHILATPGPPLNIGGTLDIHLQNLTFRLTFSFQVISSSLSPRIFVLCQSRRRHSLYYLLFSTLVKIRRFCLREVPVMFDYYISTYHSKLLLTWGVSHSLLHWHPSAVVKACHPCRVRP